jgi:hypothetical protein
MHRDRKGSNPVQINQSTNQSITTISTAELALLNQAINSNHTLLYIFFSITCLTHIFLIPISDVAARRTDLDPRSVNIGFFIDQFILTDFPACSLVFPLSVFYNSTFVPYSFWYKHHLQNILPKFMK